MRTITVQHNIYKYEELSDKAKEKAKEWYLENQDPSILEDMINEDLAFLFGRDSDLHVQFSLGYCQGDGLNIYGKLPLNKFIECIENEIAGELKEYKGYLTEEEKNTILDYIGYAPYIELPENTRYCYCIAMYANWYAHLEDSEFYECVEEIDEELIDKFNTLVCKAMTDLCRHWEKAGYEFFYEVDEDAMEEMCEANEWEFYEDGTFY